MAENLKNLSIMKWMIETGFKQDKAYQGGGILRTKAGILANKKARLAGMYKPREALTLIDEAINSSAYPGDISGADFCESYHRKALILDELNRSAQKRETINNALTYFEELEEFDMLPEGRVPETRYCMGVLRDMR